MSAARLWFDAALGIVRRDAQIFFSYRTRFLTQNVGIIFSLSLFYYLSRLVRVGQFSDPGEYFAFVTVGLIILGVLRSTFSSPLQLRQELVAGTFERMVLSPFGPVSSIVAMLVFPFLLALSTAALTLLLAALVFGLDVAWSTAALALPVGMIGALAFMPVSLIFCASVVVYKQAPGANYVLALISLVAGFYFPVSLLPSWIRWTSEIQPFTPAVDLMRHVLVGLPLQGSAAGDVARLCGFAVVLMPVGLLILGAAVRKARTRGTIIEY